MWFVLLAILGLGVAKRQQTQGVVGVAPSQPLPSLGSADDQLLDDEITYGILQNQSNLSTVNIGLYKKPVATNVKQVIPGTVTTTVKNLKPIAGVI